jgi:hypothetical protein
MNVTINNLDDIVKRKGDWLFAEISASDELLAQTIERERFSGRGFSDFAAVLRSALTWVWLKWHSDQDRNAIESTIAKAVTYAKKITSNLSESYARDLFDSHLMHLATLSRDARYGRDACDLIATNDDRREKRDFLCAWNQLLKSSLLEDEQGIKLACDRYVAAATSKQLRSPSKSLVKSFSAADSKGFGRQLAEHFRREWDAVRRDGRVVGESETSVILEMYSRNMNFFWPWDLCVLSKLALKRGVTVVCEDVWSPCGLVRGGV